MTLVKRMRLWYTDAMKALLFISKLLFCGGMILLVSCSPICRPAHEDSLEATDEEDISPGTAFTLYSAQGETHTELFYEICASEHAVVYVSAHAVEESSARTLLHRFETVILPNMPVPLETKLGILISYMEGSVYGYTPLPASEQGPVICLNALYVDDFEYVLAHEYQHLCAAEACHMGNTSLSEETDELFSDMFCQMLFPDLGRERGILSQERAQAAEDRLNAWGQDAVQYAHGLLREGYAEEAILSALGSR